MKSYKKYLGNTLAVLLCTLMFFASCKDKEEPKSEACDITLFSVEGRTWTVSSTEITRVYPPGTVEGLLTPTINLSPGATVNPPSGEAQNFFTAQGVTYTVTAENGVTKKTYVAKAIRTLSSDCSILSFKVNGTEWSIEGDSLITYVFPTVTPETPLTPVITLSPNATVTPASGEAKNFFTAEGVKYTVTSEDGTATKTYTVRARNMGTGCEILSFSVGEEKWEINGDLITGAYSAITAVALSPNIVLSPGATISPLAGTPQNFFTEGGVTYIVTSEDKLASKTYTVRATLRISGVTGACTWRLSDGVLTVRGNGPMADYDANNPIPWSQYVNNITAIIIDEGVTHVGERAFFGNTEFSDYISLTSVSISNSVRTIGYAAFAYCDRLTSVTVGNSVTTIDEFVFYACKKLGSIIIPDLVTSIGKGAFDYCYSMTSVTIGNSVQTLGEYAFGMCSSLTSVTIPRSVTSIHGQAFGGCTGLTEVTNLNPIPQNLDGVNAFLNIEIGSLTLKVPSTSVGAYSVAVEWKNFGTITGI
jgi:hypothetical protein